MLRRAILVLCGAALGAGLVSCARLQDEDPLSEGGRGQLAFERAKFLDAIPDDYGDLIGIAARADRPAWTQAWFVRPDKSIVVLWINTGSGRILDRVLVIPRRS